MVSVRGGRSMPYQARYPLYNSHGRCFTFPTFNLFLWGWYCLLLSLFFSQPWWDYEWSALLIPMFDFPIWCRGHWETQAVNWDGEASCNCIRPILLKSTQHFLRELTNDFVDTKKNDFTTSMPPHCPIHPRKCRGVSLILILCLSLR